MQRHLLRPRTMIAQSPGWQMKPPPSRFVPSARTHSSGGSSRLRSGASFFSSNSAAISHFPLAHSHARARAARKRMGAQARRRNDHFADTVSAPTPGHKMALPLTSACSSSAEAVPPLRDDDSVDHDAALDTCGDESSVPSFVDEATTAVGCAGKVSLLSALVCMGSMLFFAGLPKVLIAVARTAWSGDLSTAVMLAIMVATRVPTPWMTCVISPIARSIIILATYTVGILILGAYLSKSEVTLVSPVADTDANKTSSGHHADIVSSPGHVGIETKVDFHVPAPSLKPL